MPLRIHARWKPRFAVRARADGGARTSGASRARAAASGTSRAPAVGVFVAGAAHRVLPLVGCLRPRVGVLREGAGRADAARGPALAQSAARGGSPPALSRRSVQYSQVRLVTLGMALMVPASLVSPAVKVAILPSNCARS